MTPVEIARQALRRLAQLELPPTPENYEREYRLIGGVPKDGTPGADGRSTRQTLDMVRGLLQVMTSANAGLQADLNRLSAESSSLLAQIETKDDPKALEELFQAMTASSAWLLNQADHSRQELDLTRAQLDSVHQKLEQAQTQAVSDHLTGLPNRRALDATLSREIARARRRAVPLCLAVIDVDHFKRINDRYGHDVGDDVLVHLAKVLKPLIRETDVLARFGGEEFVLVLPDTPMASAEFTLNRLLRATERASLAVKGRHIDIRFSAGLAEWQGNETAEQLVKRADAAMYQAKATGRGRVTVAESRSHAAQAPANGG